MKEKTREAEKISELLKEAENHPLVQQILAEKAATILATRTAAAEKIVALKRERDEVLPKLQADLETKETNYKEARAELDAATSEFQNAKYEFSNEGHCFESAINIPEQILIRSADPALDEGIIFFRDKLDYLRSPGRISHNNLGGESNIFMEQITLKEESNLNAVKSAIQYCQAAIKELEEMKLSLILDVKKIEAIKKGITEINVYTESTGERPMEKVNTNPLSMLPSDGELEWRIGSVMEKVKKHLGR
jgi:hypothetical protein